MHHTDRNTHRAGFACADLSKPLPRPRSWLARALAWMRRNAP